MKLLTFNGSLKQKENKPSVSTRKDKKKAENISTYHNTVELRVYIKFKKK